MTMTKRRKVELAVGFAWRSYKGLQIITLYDRQNQPFAEAVLDIKLIEESLPDRSEGPTLS